MSDESKSASTMMRHPLQMQAPYLHPTAIGMLVIPDSDVQDRSLPMANPGEPRTGPSYTDVPMVGPGRLLETHDDYKRQEYIKLIKQKIEEYKAVIQPLEEELGSTYLEKQRTRSLSGRFADKFQEGWKKKEKYFHLLDLREHLAKLVSKLKTFEEDADEAVGESKENWEKEMVQRKERKEKKELARKKKT